MRFQLFFMLMTVQPFFLASSHSVWGREYEENGRPFRAARVVINRARLGHWLGWVGIFLSCSMTWSRL